MSTNIRQAAFHVSEVTVNDRRFYCFCIKLIFAEGRGFSALFSNHMLLQSSHFPTDSLKISLVKPLLALLGLTYVQWRC